MKTLILAAGRFGDTMKRAIADGREPRLDVFEIAERLNADMLDFLDVDASRLPAVRLATRTVGPSGALALLGHSLRKRYDAILTTGEDIGLPLASLLRAGSSACSHTMISHTLMPAKKRVFFRCLRWVQSGVTSLEEVVRVTRET
jgi:hypothetical protein